MSGTDVEVENLLRQLAPQVLGAVVRRYSSFDTAEDAVPEAMLAASTQWPSDGVRDSPKGWLITVAARRLTDLLRSEQARWHAKTSCSLGATQAAGCHREFR